MLCILLRTEIFHLLTHTSLLCKGGLRWQPPLLLFGRLNDPLV